jgi:hypothetical protein
MVSAMRRREAVRNEERDAILSVLAQRSIIAASAMASSAAVGSSKICTDAGRKYSRPSARRCHWPAGKLAAAGKQPAEHRVVALREIVDDLDRAGFSLARSIASVVRICRCGSVRCSRAPSSDTGRNPER